MVWTELNPRPIRNSAWPGAVSNTVFIVDAITPPRRFVFGR